MATVDKYNLKNPAVKRILQEENIFEWQFPIRGPNETEFEGGIYHGRIQLPAEYPFKPPSFLLLTTKDERRKLAGKSREAPPTFGGSERQKLIDEIHDYMRSKAPPDPQNQNQSSEEQPTETEAEARESEIADGSRISKASREAVDNVDVDANVNPHGEDRQVRAAVTSQVRQQQRHAPRTQPPPDDRLLTWAAVGLTVAIVFLLLKKLMRSSGYGAIFMSES